MPRSIAALIGPDPRVIADEVWAKLMWAGLNLTAEDLPSTRNQAGTARRGIRSSSSARSRCCGCSPGCASTRSSACGRRDPLAAPARPSRARAATRVCLLDVPTNKTAHRVHQAGRPARRRRDRGVAGRPARAAEVRGSQDRRAGRRAAGLPRRAARREVHQPGAGPAAVPQGRRARARTSAARSPAIAPGRRSPPSSTTPRTRCRCSSCRPGSDTQRPARPSTTRGSPRSP